MVMTVGPFDEEVDPRRPGPEIRDEDGDARGHRVTALVARPGPVSVVTGKRTLEAPHVEILDLDTQRPAGMGEHDRPQKAPQNRRVLPISSAGRKIVAEC